jgi:hypothetical protein
VGGESGNAVLVCRPRVRQKLVGAEIPGCCPSRRGGLRRRFLFLLCVGWRGNVRRR